MSSETGGDFSTPREIGAPICKATGEQVRVKGKQRHRLTPLWSNSSGYIIARGKPEAHAHTYEAFSRAHEEMHERSGREERRETGREVEEERNETRRDEECLRCSSLFLSDNKRACATQCQAVHLRTPTSFTTRWNAIPRGLCSLYWSETTGKSLLSAACYIRREKRFNLD